MIFAVPVQAGPRFSYTEIWLARMCYGEGGSEDPNILRDTCTAEIEVCSNRAALFGWSLAGTARRYSTPLRSPPRSRRWVRHLTPSRRPPRYFPRGTLWESRRQRFMMLLAHVKRVLNNEVELPNACAGVLHFGNAQDGTPTGFVRATECVPESEQRFYVKE